MLTPKEQMRIICKGVHQCVNQEELLAKLEKSYEKKEPLIIKLGLDPSAPDIHLGHAVVLRKIRQMQELGHQAVIIIGDFTGKIGDPTGKLKGREQQIALFMPILEGVDGVEKMSKSLGNYIGVSEPAEVMFKKVMEVPDDLIIKYFELTTDIHPDEIDSIKDKLSNGTNPKDIKFKLAKVITSQYHTGEELEKAISYFDMAFSKKGIPNDIPKLLLEDDKDILNDIISTLIEMDYVKSKSEFIRLIKQGGIQINGEKMEQDELNRVLINEDVIKIGKKKFIKINK